MITIQEINALNFREAFKLKVSDGQKHFVASAEVMLARAYVYRETSEAMAIYNEMEMIGYLLIRQYDGKYCLDQFMIDQSHQGKGYGKQAMKLVLEKLRNDRSCEKVILCYIESDAAAQYLYEGLGFIHTGEADEEEVVMELIL